MTEQTAQFIVRLSHEWTLPVACLPIVFGAIAYRARRIQARASAHADTHAMRISRAVRIASSTLFVASLLVLGAAISHIGCAAVKAHSTQCLSNLKKLGLAAMMYAQDYDERFPPASRWAEAIDSRVFNKNLPGREDPFRCPSAKSLASYGMNAVVSGLSLADADNLSNLVFLFEADAPIRSFSGGSQDMAKKRHSSAPNVVYADGHVKWANIYTQQQLDWIPKKVTASKTRP